MSDNDYSKLKLSLKVVSLQICSNSANSVNSVCGKLLVLSFCSFENSVTEKARIRAYYKISYHQGEKKKNTKSFLKNQLKCDQLYLNLF